MAIRAPRFPTIPHLFGSASDPGDVVLTPSQTRDFLAAKVSVAEKLDGLNVGLCFTPRGALRFVSRTHGALSAARLGPSLWPLVDFAFSHLPELLTLLGPHLVLFGEWLGGPRRLPYPRRTVEFVGFDLFDRRARAFLPAPEAARRIGAAGLEAVPACFTGEVDSVEALLALVPRSRFGGPAEGVVVTRPDGLRAKVVRHAWAKRKVRVPSPVRIAAAPKQTSRASFTKRFAGERLADAQLEASVLGALEGHRVAPRLESVEDGGLSLTLSYVGGAPFPRRASPELAASLGAQLARLHAIRLLAPALRGGPAQQVRSGPLAELLSAQRPGRGASVLCHADLKPENLRVRGGAVTLLDFERARRADPAWELACAMDRLELSAPARAALLEGYANDEPGFALRVHCFRLAWDVLLPRAVAALEADTGRKPGLTALRLAAAARARAKRLDAALARFRKPGAARTR